MVGFVKGVFGGSGLDLSAVTLTPDKALAGTKFYDANGILRTGTIASLPASTITLAGAATSIPAGKYLAGAQTIAWDSDIVSGNVRVLKNIFGVTGVYPHIGTFTPASATATYTISNIPFVPSGIILMGGIGNPNSYSWPMLAAFCSIGNIAYTVNSRDTWAFNTVTYAGCSFGTSTVTLDFSAITDGAYLEPMQYRFIIW